MTSVAAFNQHVQSELNGIRAAGLFKAERIIATPQGALVKLADGRELINLCANNYLGLSSHPAVIQSRRASASGASRSPVTAEAAPGTRRAAASTCPGRRRVLLGMHAQ